VLLTRAGCHLCDDARVIVARVVEEFGEQLLERDVDAEPGLAQQFGEQLPVLFVDDVQLDFWRVSENRLRAALAAGDDERGGGHRSGQGSVNGPHGGS
jgi:hypothetical protein